MSISSVTVRRSLRAGRPGLSSTALACAALLAACGGGNDVVAGSGASVAGSVGGTALSGTVAVGAPITNGMLRILDANGVVVAGDVPIDADGHYAAVALTGPAPYRIEACGYAAANYLCVYSVASAAGTANVTPLTTAMVLLAAGQSPDSLMSGTSAALTSVNIDAAQNQLRTSLTSVLSSFGVGSSIDFVSAALSAGSRSGYDGVLDAVGVTTGQDGQPFVQITPRIGQGNLYLEQGHSTGSVTASDTSALQLGGLETLFRDMSASLVSASACTSDATGLARSIAGNAHLSFGDSTANGPSQVADALCSVFGGAADGPQAAMWNSTLISPTLGRCDLTGAAPVCGVSFVIRSPEGDVQPVGHGLGVTREGGAWKFLGSVFPIQLEASARAQRNLRIDSTAPAAYGRAFAFEVEAVDGLQCARVAQRNSDGVIVPMAYYKRFAGATNQQRLSLWTADQGDMPSLDPAAGLTRSPDDTWMALPQGTDGDAVIRNFYRGGRSVVFSLYADSACTSPFRVAGKSNFEVDVEGVPPVWSAMPNLPWPELDVAGRSALRGLAIGAGADASLPTSWTFARGPLAVDEATLCASRSDCGDGGSGRIGHAQIRASARNAVVGVHNAGGPVAAGDGKSLILSGRNGEGVGLEAAFSSCPLVSAGEGCR